jgi:SAM-dependent methyltransferase
LEEALTLSTDGPDLPQYVARCGQQLTAVLTGQESPLETLFPGGSYDTADYLYHKGGPARYCNGIAREIVEALARNLPLRQTLRLLEVGAGTGGTTAALLPILPPGRTHYTFTDMSEFFFARAEERFKEYPFLRFGLLNLEEDAAEQGYGRHSYDLIVGANVFHATQDLGRALDNAWSLLAPGGVLLLYETTRHPTWFEVSIGLIEGWSRFHDAWRQGNPLLTPAKWQEAILAHGFEGVRAWPEAGAAAEALGVHIVVAQAPYAGQEAAGAEAGPAAPARTTAEASMPQPESAAAFLVELRESLPADQLDLLVDYVRQRVLKVTRSGPSRTIGRRDRLMDLGVDSLMAVELRTLLGADLGLTDSLPATLIFDYPSIEDIARYLQGVALPAEGAKTAPAASVVKATAGATEIEALSDEEVEALLLQKLGDL